MKELKLNRDIYYEETLQIVIWEYRDLADIQYEIENQYFVIRFSNCKYDENLTALEFENYLIGKGNQRHDYN